MSSGRRKHHGELLLEFWGQVAEFETADFRDLLGFSLMSLLGFLPLIVIHWSERWPRLGLGIIKRALWRVNIIKASLFIMLTDWSLGIMY